MDDIHAVPNTHGQDVQGVPNTHGEDVQSVFMGRLKAQSTEPLYSNMVIGTLAIDGWAVTFGTVRRGLGRLGPYLVTSLLYEM